MKPAQIRCLIFGLLFPWILCGSTLMAQSDESWKFATPGTNAEISQILNDSVGNIYVMGTFRDTIFSYGGKTVQGATGGKAENLFILKTDPIGKLIWLHSIHGDMIDILMSPLKLAINQKGETAILFRATGDTQVTFGPHTRSVASGQCLLAKVSKTGFALWLKDMKATGTFSRIDARDAVLNEEGDAIITGDFHGEYAIFDNLNIQGLSNLSNQRVFLVKYTKEGVASWAKTSDYNPGLDEGEIYGDLLSLTSDEKIILVGRYSYYGDFSFGNDTLVNDNSMNAYVACFDSDGNAQWAKAVNGDLEDQPRTLVIDEENNIVIAGFLNSDLIRSSNQSKSTKALTYSLFVTKYTPNGEVVFFRRFRTEHQNLFTNPKVKINTDEYGDIYLASNFYGSSFMEDVSITNPEPGTSELGFAKLDALSGYPQWVRTAGAIGENPLEQVAINQKGTFYITGDMDNNVRMGETSLTDVLGHNGFYLSQLSGEGGFELAEAQINPSLDEPFSIDGISSDAYNNMYAAGQFFGPNHYLDGNQLTNSDNQGIFLARFGPIGSISGRIINEQGSAMQSGIVLLYGYTKFQSSPKIDTSVVDVAGNYSFTNIPHGKYLISYVPDDESYAVSYYPSNYHWEDGNFIELDGESATTNLDILAQLKQSSSGTGSLSGTITEIDQDDLLKSTKSAKGKPSKKGSLVLASRTKKKLADYEVVAIIYPDENGFFIFSDINDGDYLLDVDIPGIPSTDIYEVTVSGGNLTEHLDFYIGEEIVWATNQSLNIVNDIEEISFDIRLYPNPANGFIKLKAPGQLQIDYLEIIDLNGQQLMKVMAPTMGSEIDIRRIEKGIYLVKTTIGNNIHAQKLIVF